MVNIEAAISYMYHLRALGITYSMDGRRDGSEGTADCSGAVYTSLRAGGASNAGWVLNTESMHSWLIANGFRRVADNTEWDAQRGDVFIWGMIGYSGGAGGHTGIFVDHDNIIHCNYGNNGVTINNHDMYWAADGGPYFYAYRYVGSANAPVKEDDNDMDLSKLTGLVPVTAYGLAWITNPKGAVLYDHNHKATSRKLAYGTGWVVTKLDNGWLDVGGLLRPDDAVVKINKGILAGDWTGQVVQVITDNAYTQGLPQPKQPGIKLLPKGSRYMVGGLSGDSKFVKVGGWIDSEKVRIEL